MKSKMFLSMLSVVMALTLALGSASLARGEGGSGGSGGDSGRSSSSSSDDSSSSRSGLDDSSSSGMEVETEHGVTFLKPHGGDDAASLAARAAARALEVEDESGLEVEVEHGVTFLKPHGGARDAALENRVRGRILLQVERHGEAWFMDPATRRVAFLGRPADALQVMREFGLGISNADLAKIAVADDKGGLRGDARLAQRLAGRIVLQVEDKGQAWWIDPETHERHSLGRPEDALRVMRSRGLGISDDNMAKLGIAHR